MRTSSYRKAATLPAGLGLIGLLVFITALVGYVMIIIKLLGAETFYIEEGIRVLGIFAGPLGAIMGLFVS